MKDKSDLVRGLLRKSRSDAKVMRASKDVGALDAACFHAQQAVEKALKAYLAHHGISFPYTHNLAKLVELAGQVDERFSGLVSVVEPLTPYAVEARYDEDFWPTRDDVDRALVSADSATDFIIECLPEEIGKE